MPCVAVEFGQLFGAGVDPADDLDAGDRGKGSAWFFAMPPVPRIRMRTGHQRYPASPS
jgi:hypothetical protein